MTKPKKRKKPEEKSTAKSIIDPEVNALATICWPLEPLRSVQVARILEYIEDRYKPQSCDVAGITLTTY